VDSEIKECLSAGLSIANGLHTAMSKDPELSRLVTRPEQFIWDIRQEPEGLHTASGLARETKARRVLFVGTDMGNGKMTASLELTKALKESGLRAKFLATGQIGIAIAGEGVPLDAVRVDYAAGSIEQMVVRNGSDHDILLIEGQGSLFHPASSATLSLLRGAMPTHLILVHEIGKRGPSSYPWVQFPPLPDVIRLYESVASAAGALPAAKVAAIALNTAYQSGAEARRVVDQVQAETGLPVTDVIRFGTGLWSRPSDLFNSGSVRQTERSVVRMNHLFGRAIGLDAAFGQPNGAGGDAANGIHVMRDKDDGAALALKLGDLGVALFLKDSSPTARVSSTRMIPGRCGRRPRNRGARTYPTNRYGLGHRSTPLLEIGEGADGVHAALHLGAGQAEDRPVEDDVLVAGKVRMKARAHLQQRRDLRMGRVGACGKGDGPPIRQHDMGHQGKQRRFSRTRFARAVRHSRRFGWRARHR
jgi:uncharacterized NAD-dependent epimerase/dehydratase family protein